MNLGPIEEDKRQKRFLRIDALNPDFRTNAQGMNKEELNNKIAEIAKLEQANQEAKKADPAISKAKEEMKGLTTPYREDSKNNKLFSEFLVWVAENKGWA